MLNFILTDTRHGISSNRRAIWALLGVFALLGAPRGASAAVLHLADGATGIAGQQFGAAMSGLEDISGDGLAELLVGAPGYQSGGSDTGAVFLWLGNTAVTEAAQEVWYGVANESFGFSVAAIGDVNGDERPDFAVGAPLNDSGGQDRGRVCVFYGSPNLSSEPDLVIQGEAAYDQFGFSVAAAGDFNGDGKDDFIVGAPYHDSPGQDAGAAYIVYGATGGPSDDLADALKLTGQVGGDLFGWSVCPTGNFLGGNEDGVAVGAPSYDSFGTDAGAVFVFEGVNPPSNPDATHDHVCRVGGNSPAYSLFGWVVRHVGRWDSDGYDDLAVGAPGNRGAGLDAGRAEIFFGDPSPSEQGDRYVTGQDGGDKLGYSLVGGQDWSGNGKDDVLIGAPFHSGDGAEAGRAYLWAGGSSSGSFSILDAIAVDPMVSDSAANDRFGSSLAACSDFDGDGAPDHGIGAPGGNIAANNSTAGYCRFLASDPQTVGNEDQSIHFGWQPDGTVAIQIRLDRRWSDVAELKVYRREETYGGVSTGRSLLREGRVPANTGAVFAMTDPLDALSTSAERMTYIAELHLRSGRTFYLENSAQLDVADRPDPDLLVGSVWPNPANPRASMEFQVPAGQAYLVTVHDLRGREVALIRQGTGTGQTETAVWNGLDATGRALPSGTYFFRLLAGQQTEVRKVVLAR